MDSTGHRIRRLRDLRGLSQTALAVFAGRSTRWMVNVEGDLTDLRAGEAAGLAEGLRVPVEVVMGFAPIPARLADRMPPPPSTDPASADQLVRLAEASDVGAGTMADVEEATYRLRRAYSTTPSAALVADLRAQLATNHRLLAGRLRISQKRDLMESNGWLGLLLGTAHFDLAEREPAWSYRAGALAIARELGHAEMEAWCWETAAWFTLAEDRFHETIRYAEAGVQTAPMSSVLVALHLQTARAAARLGDSATTDGAISSAAGVLDRLADADDQGDHYKFDAGKLDGFAAAAYVSIGDPVRAIHHARRSLALSGDPRSPSYRPMRVNSAHADMGMALALQGEVYAAAGEGVMALGGDLVHPEAVKRVAELAAALRPHESSPAVRQLRERLRDSTPLRRPGPNP
jgi:transcriptional regulator with XRE-family HTH domain